MTQTASECLSGIAPLPDPIRQAQSPKKWMYVSEGEAQRYANRQKAELSRKKASFWYASRTTLTLLLGLSAWVYASGEMNNDKGTQQSVGHQETKDVTEVLSSTTLDAKQVTLNQAIAALDEAHQKTLLLKNQIEQLQEKLQAVTATQQDEGCDCRSAKTQLEVTTISPATRPQI